MGSDAVYRIAEAVLSALASLLGSGGPAAPDAYFGFLFFFPAGVAFLSAIFFVSVYLVIGLMFGFLLVTVGLVLGHSTVIEAGLALVVLGLTLFVYRLGERRPLGPRKPLLIPLGRVGPGLDKLVGGKAGTLGALTQAGYPTAPGIVITPRGFRLALAAAGLSAPWSEAAARLRAARDRDSALQAMTRLHGLVNDTPAPASLVLAVIKALDNLKPAPGASDGFIFRSSFKGEDLAEAGFAGIFESVADVSLEYFAVEAAIKSCWLAGFTDRVAEYRLEMGLGFRDHGADSVSILVQRMLEPELMGTMLTAHPVTGARDRMVIDFREPASGLEGGVELGRIDNRITPLYQSGLLSDRELLQRLAAAADELENMFGAPQNVEWALCGPVLYLLQSRPVTLLQHMDTWVNAHVVDLISEPLTPLSRSILETRFGMDRLLLGPIEAVTGVSPVGESNRKAVRYFHGRPYARWEALRALGGEFRPSFADRGSRINPLKLWIKTWIMVFRAVLFTHGKARRWTAAASRPARSRDLAGLSDAELAAEAEAAMRQGYDIGLDIHARCTFIYGLLWNFLRGKAPVLLGDDGRDLLLDWINAGEDNRFRAYSRALREAAAGRMDRHGFLSAWGHRGPREDELAAPRWRNHPEALERFIAGLGPEPPGPGPEPETQRVVAARLRAAAPLKWLFYSAVIGLARKYSALRENPKDAVLRQTAELRDILVEMGRRLAGRGSLEASEQAFFLELDALSAALLGEARDVNPARKAEAARRAHEENLAADAPHILYTNESGLLVQIKDERPAAGAELTGVTAVGGTASGPAFKPRSLEPGAMPDNAVLVLASPNPAWAAALGRTAALVIETGSPICHLALVAREFGVPTLVSVARARDLLSDGEQVAVDAGRGIVVREGGGRP